MQDQLKRCHVFTHSYPNDNDMKGIKNAENFASSEIFCNFAPDFIANQKLLKPRWRNR